MVPLGAFSATIFEDNNMSVGCSFTSFTCFKRLPFICKMKDKDNSLPKGGSGLTEENLRLKAKESI